MSASSESLFNDPNWNSKVSNPAQIGGIETSILDNGPGRNSRIAWVNTGSGLRFKVVPDRGLDIAEAFMNAWSLSWISHHGTVSPRPFAIQGVEWLRSFGGGMVTTCGLDHVGGPENDEYGVRGLHGEISNIPAEIISIVQPDLYSNQNTMSITGRMLQSTVFEPHLELIRTISVRLGSSEIQINDKVRNIGNQPAPHMILYHLNFGWPLIDQGTKILWQGEWISRDSDMDRKIFNNDNDFRTCPDVLESHSGGGEAAVFIDPDADQDGRYHFGLYNPKIGLEVMVSALKNQLPALTNWQHFGQREYVLGLEPGTHHPIGQSGARDQGNLIYLQPDESREYDLKFDIKLK